MTKLAITASPDVRKQAERSQRAKQAWISRKVRAEFTRNTWRLEHLEVDSHYSVGYHSSTLLTALNALIKHRVTQQPNEVYEIDVTKLTGVAVWRVA